MRKSLLSALKPLPHKSLDPSQFSVECGIINLCGRLGGDLLPSGPTRAARGGRAWAKELFRCINRMIDMASIIIRPQNGRLFVFFPYAPERVAKIKTVPGRLWHKAEQCWSVPDEPDMRTRLDALFRQTAAPPAVPLDAPLERLRAAMRARHLSRRSEESYIGWTR